MGKLGKNETGFSAIEVVMVLVIVALIGVVGFMAYNKNHNKTPTNSASTAKTTTKTSTKPATIDPYAGWKSYTLPVEKLSFKYPASWTVDAADTGAPTSTQDQVTIDATDGFTFSVLDGVSNGGDAIPQASNAAIPVKYLGQSDYLVFNYARNTDGPGFSNTQIGGGGLQTDPSKQGTYPVDKTAVGPNDTTGAVNAKNILISIGFKPTVTLTQAQSNLDVKSVEMIVQSMTY